MLTTQGAPVRKRFGQHFLHDPVVIAQIMQAVSPGAQDRIVEIGPGEGVLTIPLLQCGRRVDAVEIDRDLAAGLRQHAAGRGVGGRLRVFCADALHFEFAPLAQAGKIRVVGNLPYNISTPLLLRMTRLHAHIRDMHFMLQREVANGLSAQPGGPDYSRLSVMTACCFDTLKLFDVPPRAFDPPPAVVSSFIRMTPRAAPPAAAQLSQLDEIVKLAFSKRRKTLANALSAQFDEATLHRAGVNPRSRPDALGPSDYLRVLKCSGKPEPTGEINGAQTL